uniref:Protein PTHB1 n=1 Tax=Magallana gigas TaxID=29159 RepID=K1QAR1_MAGGI
MSLFKARDWWSTTVGEEEEFDLGCLCVANIDNATDELDKIIIGSYHGILRIFNPKPTKTDDGWSGYKPEDVLLEASLPEPILQLEAGKFVSGTENLHLAVLHPRKIAVYKVGVTSGAVEHGRHFQLNMSFEHNLKRTAFNFCFGPFGGVKGRDFLCVQSMDGTVSIFEQESFSFCRFLPGALLPGPIRYMPKLDSFVTVSSTWQLECYKYQVLAVATDAKTKEESQNIKSGKRVTWDWCYNLGEQALDLVVVNYENCPPSILVLVVENTINCLIGTHTTNSLMVYQDITLKWAAKLDFTPVQVKLATFQDLKGVIVTLSDKGRLECSYLGTDPALFIPPVPESRELNYADMDREMAQLQKRIKQSSHKAVLMPNLKKQEDDLQLLATVNTNFDDVSMATEVEFEDPDPVPSITVRVQVKARLTIEHINMHVHACWPLKSNVSSFEISSVDPSNPSEQFVSFFIVGKAMPADMTVSVSANYMSASGAPRVATARVKLPVKLVIKPVAPVKNAEFKLTLDSNKPPANLNELFPDLLGENAGGQGAALGFQYYGNGPIVTVLASKTSQRYRLQCDRFEAMWLMVKELSGRLNSHFNRGKNDSFALYFAGQLPLQEYFDLIDAHFEHRLNADRCKEMLNQRASQFRAIQRRLLTRFKDKTPSPLANLDTLLEGTYRQILHLADTIEENNQSQEVAALSLSSATSLFNYLIKLWTNMSEEEYKVLQQCVSPVVSSSTEQGWQESVDAAVTHLLRTTLAKSSKDQTLNPQPLHIPEDTTKVKKHLALMCDKLGKGARLVEGLPTNSMVNMNPTPRKEKKDKISATSKTVMENGHIDNSDDTETLIGSQFGQHKSKRNKDQDYGSDINGLSDLSMLGLPAENVDDGMTEKRKKKHIEAMVPDLDDMDDEPVALES